MSLFRDVYYIIISDGVPVEVQTEWKVAQAAAEQYKTANRTASILPVKPMAADDFLEEEETNPEVQVLQDRQMDFDFSDVNPEVV